VGPVSYSFALLGLRSSTEASAAIAAKEDWVLDFERLDVYRVAREFNRWVEQLVRDHLRAHSDLAEQLRRASMSIAANIAEGAGEYSVNEKARFYRIARRSATEAGSLLHTIADRGVTTEANLSAGHGMVERIVAMLVRLTRAVENRPRSRLRPSP
jgi:four helix bundle protein